MKLKYLSFIILSLCFACIGVQAKVVYVSSSSGNDKNDGTIPALPKASVSAACSCGDTLLLKAGDLFYENLVIQNKFLSRYGTGPNPKFCGYKRISEPKWESAGKNIWKLSLKDDNFTGFVTNGSSKLNNIGLVHEYDCDSVHGNKVQYKKNLLVDWDIWQTERFSYDISPAEFDSVYLYLTRNPNKLKLEFAIGEVAMRIANTTLDHINVEGYGFGISITKQADIRYCKIDAIGGMLALGASIFSSYGNGIEFWVGKDDVADSEVSDCFISRCYDCGMSIQGIAENGVKKTARNVRIHDNMVYRCCQSWEDFLLGDTDRSYENCSVYSNLFLASGDVDFRYTPERFKFCAILSGNNRNDVGLHIRDNLIIGGNYFCAFGCDGLYRSHCWSGNEVYTTSGSFIISNYYGTKDVIRVPSSGKTGKFRISDTLMKYRYLTGDTSTLIYVRSEPAIKSMITREKVKFLSKKQY